MYNQCNMRENTLPTYMEHDTAVAGLPRRYMAYNTSDALLVVIIINITSKFSRSFTKLTPPELMNIPFFNHW